MSTQRVQGVLLFLVLAVNSALFWILRTEILDSEFIKQFYFFQYNPTLASFPGPPRLFLIAYKNWSPGRPGNEANPTPRHMISQLTINRLYAKVIGI